MYNFKVPSNEVPSNKHLIKCLFITCIMIIT